MLERLQKAERAVELAKLGTVQADVDHKQAAAAAQLITSLQLIPNAACAVGSVLVVKITDHEGARVVVRTLTQKQMIAMERDDRLMRDPRGLLKYLDGLDDVGPGPASLDAGPRDT
jgi:type I restriction enzyme, R subunit